MKRFSQLLNKLYFTYGNLDKMSLIMDYLSTTPDPDRGYALAIIANTLEFPTFKSSIIKELMQNTIDPILFGLSYDYVGDLSETIALIWPDPVEEQQLPTLSEIIHIFNTIPNHDIKECLSDLLNKSNSTERWALLKLGTGSLRIGISSRFIKNTLAKYGDVNVQEIEHLWHGLKPPYLELFDWLEKKHAKPIITDQIFFHPVMLSHPLTEKDIPLIHAEHFSFERKYDGIRVQIVSTGMDKGLFTRTGDNISHSFPDVLDSIEGKVVLDGELVIKTDQGVGSFNELQKRLNRKSPSKKMMKEQPGGIILYDILFLNDVDLRPLPFIKRREQLIEWVKNQSASTILLSDVLVLDQNQTLHDLKQHVLLENHPAVEGLMIKNNLSPYLAGRPKGHWYKWKRDPLIVDAVLMYAQRGHGKRSSFYSDYTFGLWQNDQLLPIGKAYFGFTDEELKVLDKWVRHHTIENFGPVREVSKDLVLEVAFDAVNLSSRHKSGVALRFPRINRIRWDKPAEEADQLETLVHLIKT